MADAEFKFESDEWRKFLKKIGDNWDDIKKRKEFAGIVSIVAFRDIIDHFKEERGPDGKWVQRSPSYKKWAEKNNYTKILQVSGRLRNSLQPGDGKFRSNSSGVVLYTKVPYAGKHDEGKDGMPERKFMWLSKKGFEQLVKQTLEFLKRGLK